MSNKLRILSCILYALGLGLFFTAQYSVVGGSILGNSILSQNHMLRVVFCSFAIISIIAATFCWKSRTTPGKVIKLIIMIGLIAFIAVLGFKDNRIASSASLSDVLFLL